MSDALPNRQVLLLHRLPSENKTLEQASPNFCKGQLAGFHLCHDYSACLCPTARQEAARDQISPVGRAVFHKTLRKRAGFSTQVQPALCEPCSLCPSWPWCVPHVSMPAGVTSWEGKIFSAPFSNLTVLSLSHWFIQNLSF